MAIITLEAAGCSLFNRVATYTEADTSITTSINQEFIIALHNPSPRVGNRWYDSYDDTMFSLIDMEYTPDDKSHPDFGGTQNYRFRPLKEGKTEATFTYRTATDKVIRQKVFSIDISSSEPLPASPPEPTPAPAPASEPTPTPSPTPLPAPESELPFKMNISPSEASYLPGEEIMYGIGITNLSSGTITIDPFPPASQIKPVGQDEVVYSSAAGTRTHDIGLDYPSSWYHTIGSWDQKDNNGEQVAPGWYELSYEYVIVEQNTSKRYAANLTARFQIVHPDSAMNKDLDVNQSVTAEGITVTLERLELNAVNVAVYTFTTPPGYSMPKEHPPEQAESLGINSRAEYSVNGGIIKQPVDIGAQFNESGARLIWDLDPIPVDAKELTFTITQLGDWEGRWEFKIPLEPPTPAPEPTTAPSPTPISPYHTTPRGPPEYGLGGVSNRSIYSLGEPVIFEVFIQNMRSTPMVLSPIPPKMEIRLRKSPEEEVEIVETIAPGTGEVKLEPGEKWPYTLVWDQRDSNGQQLAPGYYTPNIWVKDIKIDGKAGDYFGVALSVLIQPPPEPGVKILDINQSQTVNGINFILERIELTSGKMKVYTSVRPVGPVNIFVVSAEAEYSFDAGPAKSAGKSETGILRHMLRIWDNLDPISPDAKELNFVITRFHDVEGSWEFRVPLE